MLQMMEKQQRYNIIPKSFLTNFYPAFRYNSFGYSSIFLLLLCRYSPIFHNVAIQYIHCVNNNVKGDETLNEV